MRIRIDTEQRQAIQLLGGLGLTIISGNPWMVGAGLAIATEAVVEKPIKDLVNLAKIPIARFRDQKKARFH